jgi:hypothetical protein
MSESKLENHPSGEYRFLPGIAPYSCGVIAANGQEIVHVTLARPLLWHEGIVRARKFIETRGRERQALCAFELRCPDPHSMGGFIQFNTHYCALLEEWDMMVGDCNPVARTNVSPVSGAPVETMLHAFSYTEPSETRRPTFVVAGAGELREGTLEADRIIRPGETSEDAILEKARYVVEVMRERLNGLGADDDLLTTIDVYTAHPLRRTLAEVITPGLPSTARLGVHWFHTRPPVVDIEFEMDMRGVRREYVVDLV